MANEWTLIKQIGPIVSFTCDSGTGIEKGTALKISDPNTVAATSADGDAFIGVAAREHEANDGDQIAVSLGGIYRVKDSGAGVTAGDALKINGANLVATADEAGAQGAKEICGFALETAGASDTFLALIGKVIA